MEIIFSARHANLAPEIKDYAQNKIDAILEGRPLKITSINVILDIEKSRNLAEVIINIKNHDVESKAEAYDMYEAIDTVVDKIETQIARYLDKKQDHHNHKRDKGLVSTPGTELGEEEDLEEVLEYDA